MTVDPDVQPSGEVKMKELTGGLYAVKRCKISSITKTWKNLVKWCKNYKHDLANRQLLEECLTWPIDLTSDMEFDLHIPIEK